MPRFFAKHYLNYVLLFIQISFLSCKLGIQSNKNATDVFAHVFVCCQMKFWIKSLLHWEKNNDWSSRFSLHFGISGRQLYVLMKVQERQLTFKFTSKYCVWPVLHKTTWKYYETTCSPVLPTQPFSLMIHDTLHHTFLHSNDQWHHWPDKHHHD